MNLFTVPYVMIRQDVAEGQNLSSPAVTSRKDVRTLGCREHTHAHAHTHTRESERERENERERVRERERGRGRETGVVDDCVVTPVA